MPSQSDAKQARIGALSFVTAKFVLFMAIVAIAYFAIPVKWRWTSLLVGSYVFYFLCSEWLILVMFAQTRVTFLCGRWMAGVENRLPPPEENRDNPASKRERKQLIRAHRKRGMLVGVIVNVGALLFLKYYNFFADNANHLLMLVGMQMPPLGLLLPIGISFYTLQAVAYIMDVYRGKIEADASLPRFMLFMSYFPQILQGPIPRHGKLAGQLYEGHRFDYQRFCFGAQLILWGFMKKLVIADRLAIPVNQIFDNYSYYSGLIVFLAAAGYGLQVYADFSGGIDIARGFSQALGINLEENFRQPYHSRSIEEFWRRWHITLGAWMRDYVFYPLSLSKAFSRIGKQARKLFGTSAGKKIPPFIAMFIVYFLVGFWHGSSWKFIAYGIWNGIFIMFGILLADQYSAAKKKCHINEESASWRFFQMFRTFVLCSIGRYFSRAKTLKTALRMMGLTTVGFFDLSFITDGSLLNLGLDTANWVLLLIAIQVLFYVDIKHEKGFHFREAIARQGIVVRWIIYLAAIAIPLVFGVYGTGFDSAAFIYQQF